MAITTLSDLTHNYDLNVLWDQIQILSPTKVAYFNSGIITTDQTLQGEMTAGGNGRALEFSIPIVDDLADSTEAAVATADATTATADKITTDDMRVAKQFRTKGWGVPDLMASFQGGDLMNNIRNLYAPWWGRHYQRCLVAATRGVLNANVAGTGSMTANDMVNAAQLSGAGTPAAANKISASALIDAAATMGDRSEELTTVAFHSSIYHQLKTQQLIEYLRDIDSPAMIPFYQGYRVIVDDGLTPVNDGDRDVYPVVLFAPGAFMWGLGMPKNAIEVDRKPEEGTGAGTDYLWTRTNYAVHPYGFTYLKDAGGAQSGVSPTFANLATAAKWDRVVDRKNVKMAFLTVNI